MIEKESMVRMVERIRAVENIVKKLTAERDEALRDAADLGIVLYKERERSSRLVKEAASERLWKEAYREVAINYEDRYWEDDSQCVKNCEGRHWNVDAEARRIVEAKP